MAPIRSQVRRDPARTRALANARRHQQIRLGILRIGHGGITGLTKCRNVVEINAEVKSSHGINDE